MKPAFNPSLTGKRFSGNKFRAIINRRQGFDLPFSGDETNSGEWPTLRVLFAKGGNHECGYSGVLPVLLTPETMQSAG
jgi:hypothetical protein